MTTGELRLGELPYQNLRRVVVLPWVNAVMTPPLPFSRWLPSSVNRLALKIAVPMTALGALGMSLTGSTSLWIVLGGAFGLGSGAYAVAHYWLHRRLRNTRETLDAIRRHAFEDLNAPPSPPTDEMGLLYWTAYHAGQTLENDIQKLEERENYRRQFIGNVSHELKTPIFSIQGFTETLLDGALNDPAVNRTFLKKILRNGTRLETLARDLSAITKIETGEMHMSAEPLDLPAIFDEVRESVEIKAKVKNVTVHSTVPDDTPTVYGDRDRIRRVIVNLADNAIKYNDEGGTVHLRATPTSADEINVSVDDDGIGIPTEDISRLTERFYRVDKSRSRNQGGTGLGLAIVKHILAAHGQELHIESKRGEGSTFSFRLPTTPTATQPPT